MGCKQIPGGEGCIGVDGEKGLGIFAVCPMKGRRMEVHVGDGLTSCRVANLGSNLNRFPSLVESAEFIGEEVLTLFF